MCALRIIFLVVSIFTAYSVVIAQNVTAILSEFPDPVNLTAPAPALAPAMPDNVIISSLLEKAGCMTFVKLITETGVLKVYQLAAAKGLTVFAPLDEAFTAFGLPDLNQLTYVELVALLKYQALPSYTPEGSLKTTKDPLTTLATNGTEKYNLTVETAGDSVTLDSGVVTSSLARMVLDLKPLCIFTVENVLLPIELFGSMAHPAISSEPATAPSPFLSPPVTPTSAPADSHALSDGPTADSINSNTTNDVEIVKAPSFFLALAAMSMSFMMLDVLC